MSSIVPLVLTVFSAASFAADVPGLDHAAPGVTAPSAEVDASVSTSGSVRRERDRSQRDQMVVGSPTLAPLGLNVTYGRMLGDRFAVVGGAGFGRSALASAVDVKLQRTRFSVGADWLPKANGFDGLYLGSRVGYQVWNFGMDGADLNQQQLTTSALLGYRIVSKRGFTIGMGLGAGYTMPLGETGDVDALNLKVGRTGFGLAGETRLGMAF